MLSCGFFSVLFLCWFLDPRCRQRMGEQDFPALLGARYRSRGQLLRVFVHTCEPFATMPVPFLGEAGESLQTCAVALLEPGILQEPKHNFS